MAAALEYEEEGGCGSEEEAKDECSTDSCAEGYVVYICALLRPVSPVSFCIDLTELDLPSTMKTHFPDLQNLLNFTLTIAPDEGGCIAFTPCYYYADSVA